MKQTTVVAREWVALGETQPVELTLAWDGETLAIPEMDTKPFVVKPAILRGLRDFGWVLRASSSSGGRIDITSTEMARALDALDLVDEQ